MSDADTLPRADAAEQYLIALPFVRPDYTREVMECGVSATDLIDPLHQRIWRSYHRQYSETGEVDALLAAKETGEVDAAGYLYGLRESEATGAFIAVEAAKIIDARRKRQWYDHHQTLAAHALNGWSPQQLEEANEAFLHDARREREATTAPERFSLSDLCRQHPSLSPPVINGLLREGETANVIADSKVGKSWLGYGLLWSVVTGQHWLGRFGTTPGKVLLIDNELHRSTLAHRIPAVADAMGIDASQHGEDFAVWPMRGRLRSLADIAAELHDIEPHTYSVILLDAKYRFIAPGVSENDNAAETQFYNLVDQIAEHTRAAVVMIHHASKGDQSNKKVTDVGSGAGAQSRAADCHLVIRDHEEPGVAVIEAAVRSFAPVDPLPIAWEFPLWRPAFGVDPGKLKGRLSAKQQQQSEEDIAGMAKTTEALEQGEAGFNELCRRTGYGKDKQRRLVNMLCAQELVLFSEITEEGKKCHRYKLAPEAQTGVD